MAYKPEGYTSVAPYLVVADVRAHLAFLDGVFMGTRLRFMERPDGSVEHAEYRIDDTVVMFGEAEGWGTSHVHVYCADPDAVFTRAAEAGADIAEPLAERGDGDRRGGFSGPPGVVWWVARQVGGGR
jgi:uncharacterized glyoxalase superfamily protein PhnB